MFNQIMMQWLGRSLLRVTHVVVWQDSNSLETKTGMWSIQIKVTIWKIYTWFYSVCFLLTMNRWGFRDCWPDGWLLTWCQVSLYWWHYSQFVTVKWFMLGCFVMSVKWVNVSTWIKAHKRLVDFKWSDIYALIIVIHTDR